MTFCIFEAQISQMIYVKYHKQRGGGFIAVAAARMCGCHKQDGMARLVVRHAVLVRLSTRGHTSTSWILSQHAGRIYVRSAIARKLKCTVHIHVLGPTHGSTSLSLPHAGSHFSSLLKLYSYQITESLNQQIKMNTRTRARTG